MVGLQEKKNGNHILERYFEVDIISFLVVNAYSVKTEKMILFRTG